MRPRKDILGDATRPKKLASLTALASAFAVLFFAAPALAAFSCAQSGNNIVCTETNFGNWQTQTGVAPDYIIRETLPNDVWATPASASPTAPLIYVDGCLGRNEDVSVKLYGQYVDPGNRTQLDSDDPDAVVSCVSGAAPTPPFSESATAVAGYVLGGPYAAVKFLLFAFGIGVLFFCLAWGVGMAWYSRAKRSAKGRLR